MKSGLSFLLLGFFLSSFIFQARGFEEKNLINLANQKPFYAFQLDSIKIIRKLRDLGHSKEQIIQAFEEGLSMQMNFPFKGRDGENILTYLNMLIDKEMGVLSFSDFLNGNLSYQANVNNFKVIEGQAKVSWKRHLAKGFAGLEIESHFKNNLLNQSGDEPGMSSSNGVRIPGFPRTELSKTNVVTYDSTFYAKPSLDFMGVSLSSGPTLSFQKRSKITTWVVGSGKQPITVDIGGQTLINHTEERRIIFLCKVNTQSVLATNIGTGGTLMGYGAQISRDNWDALSVTKTSSVQYIPFASESGKRTTLNDVFNYCHKKFAPSLESEIEAELRTTISHLKFSHTEYQCATDNDCNSIHQKNIWMIRNSTLTTCDAVKKGEFKVNLCRLKSLRGHACPMYKNGKRITKGSFEYPCAKGLTCKLTKEPGFFTRGEAQCF